MSIDDTQPPGTDTPEQPADKAELTRRVEEKTAAVQAAADGEAAPQPAKKATRKAAAKKAPAKKAAAKKA